MKFAYLLLVHKNPEQIEKLVSTLISNDVFIIIHVDNKIDINPFVKILDKKQYQNVFFCSDRESVNWGGFSMVKATVKLMKKLIELNVKPDYVSLLSGQDYPLKKNEEINLFFKENNGKNFIQYFKIPIQLSNDVGNGFERILYWHWMDKHGPTKARKLRSIQEKLWLKRSFPKGVEPYLGSQWWTLQYDCVEYLFNQCNENNKLYRFYKNTFVPDEMIFQTLIMNSAFKDSVENENMRFINWNGQYVHNLTPNDWSRINNSKYHFARKFDLNIDAEVIKYLDMKRDILAYRKQFELNFLD